MKSAMCGVYFLLSSEFAEEKFLENMIMCTFNELL